MHLPHHLLHLQLLPPLPLLLLRRLTRGDADLAPSLGQPARLTLSIVMLPVVGVGTRWRWRGAVAAA